MKKTHEGALAYEHSLDHGIEFFSKAGSLFEKKESFYGSEESALSLFQKIWIVDKEVAFKLLLWLRDCRGGAGNRSGSKTIFNWLGNQAPEWIIANLFWIPTVGRWDDLKSLYSTFTEDKAVGFWANALREGNVLSAKWANRKDYPLRKALSMNEANFRKTLAKIRKGHIVEFQMCSKMWDSISYKKVPSVAMARYTNAFGKHDSERFNSYKESLKKGETTVHASVLFPHDCVRTAFHGDKDIANAQFDALPNFLEGTNEKIIVIADTSASMTSKISGSVQAIHVSQGLALYCSDKIGNENPFYRKFIQFCSESKFVEWKNMSFSDAVFNIFDNAVGSTRIDLALESILEMAKFFSLKQEQMPTTLLIVSDMQFSEGTSSNGTQVEIAMRNFKASGYEAPKIVYWDTAGYLGSQATVFDKNIALVSGFSGAILKSIFGGKDFSPIGVMLKALEKYEIIVPE